MTVLHDFLRDAAKAHADRVAVRHPGRGEIRYRELDALSDRVSGLLRSRGVGRGDRVGFCMPKSIESIVSIYGILKCGAAYVPTDPTAPASRNAFIFDNCRCRVVLAEEKMASKLRGALDALKSAIDLIELPACLDGSAFDSVVQEVARTDRATSTADPAQTEDLAYILYTSGSTGHPKGVMLTHHNATSFVDWCTMTFSPDADDRCSSHAPLHFDLSILDVHMTLRHGATLVLVDEQTGKDPAALAKLIASERLSIWYSAPSILALLAQFGALETFDLSSLRLVLFAGEVFPIKHLRDLMGKVTGPRYFNLYGPTETNVCTAFEVTEPVADDGVEPLPIGRVCAHLEGRVVDASDRDVPFGQEGELVIRGANVTQGYWELPERNASAFIADPDGDWYRTGDIVADAGDGNYTFLGRRDRMVKKRGYRIELDEIEACLYQHEEVEEVGVVAANDDALGLRITAFLGGEPISIIKLKAFCAQRVPSYMVPDVFRFEAQLPRTSTGKVDYQQLLKIEAQ